MNATEAGQLLAFAALYDNRKVSDPDVMALLKAIGDLEYADCETAVAGHYGVSTERIMPGHIRTRVKAIRAGRLARNPLPAPPPELADQPGDYAEAVREGIRQIASARTIRNALPAGEPLPGDPPPEWRSAREVLAERSAEPEPRDPREIAREQADEARAERGRREGSQEAS